MEREEREGDSTVFFVITRSDHRHWLHRIHTVHIVLADIVAIYGRNFSGTACDRILGPATLIIFNPISLMYLHMPTTMFSSVRVCAH